MLKGHSRATDSGLIIHAFHAFNAGLKADVWFEYVRSKANIADLPSRRAFAELALVLTGVSTLPVDTLTVPSVAAWAAPLHSWAARSDARHSRLPV